MCEMEIDPSEETLDKFDVRGKVEEGKLVLYDKKNIAVMGRCLRNTKAHNIINSSLNKVFIGLRR